MSQTNTRIEATRSKSVNRVLRLRYNESSVSGTTGWVKQEFELDVRSYDPELYIGVVLLGTGSVLIDDVRIEPLDL